MKKLPFAFFLLLFPLLSIAQLPADTAAMIDAVMNYYKSGNPGAQLAISRNGQLIYSKAKGMANLEYNVPLTTESLIECGSVSKQFTAAAILLLEQQGKLSVNDDVRKYVPELPDYGHTIRIYHLLHHTSGLRDWGSLIDLVGWPRGTRNYTNEHALMIICGQTTLNNIPGAEHIYSNSNYNMLATIVERVSGRSLQQFTDENIFQRAGMKHTQWRANIRKVVPNRATAYSKGPSTYFTNMPNENVHGHGGLLTSAEDLLAWNNFYLGGKFGTPSLLPQQLITRPLNHGQRNNYAAGLVVDSVRGWKRIWHNGSTASYRCNLEYFPQLGLSIAWISNTSELDGSNTNIADSVRNLLVRNIIRDDSEGVSGMGIGGIDNKAVQSHAGWYKNTRTGNGIRIMYDDGDLKTNRGPLSMRAQNKFTQSGNTILFVTKEKKALFITPINDTIIFTRVDSAIVDEKYLAEFIGVYHSPELESGFHVIHANGKLVLQLKPTIDFPMDPSYKDGFNTPPGPMYFDRNNKGEITGFRISPGRARNVLFTRKQ
jgi:CubicO group peptidase (beta-lactamase class C family)